MFLSVLDSPQSSIYRLEPTSLWEKCFEHIRKCYLYAKECHDSRSMKNAAKGDAAAFFVCNAAIASQKIRTNEPGQRQAIRRYVAPAVHTAQAACAGKPGLA